MLYVLATPLGNLDDMSTRALEYLRDVNLIIAENPSHTRKLLDHYQIKNKKLVQFADHNEQKVLSKLVEELRTTNACIVTDAGTPGISDPGFRLVRACREAGIPITPIPGPSAVITALSASGLPTDTFLFTGFLPKTEPKLIRVIEEAKSVKATLIAYESPQRILKTLQTIAKQFPGAHVVIARELTKIHEEFLDGTAAQIIERLQARQSIKGEITLLLSFK